MRSFPNSPKDNPAAAAAAWLARRDRGMTAAEQDEYLDWLQKDPKNGAALRHLEVTWRLLDRLEEWRPANSPMPNPDLLAPRPASWRNWGYSIVGLAAAAAVAVGLFLTWPGGLTGQKPREPIIHPGAERMVLEDGSVAELNVGAVINVAYTPTERRVTLVRGEGLFSVARNPARPFIVSAGRLEVCAVGTAFAVSMDADAVSVLVTEGKVRLDEAAAEGSEVRQYPRELSHVVAGQQAVVALSELVGDGGADLPTVQVRDVTPADIQIALSWQGIRLEFVDMPLRDVVKEFNRYNVRKLVVADEATGRILVGGSFRADNVDTFARLLTTGFGVSVVEQGEELLLRSEP